MKIKKSLFLILALLFVMASFPFAVSASVERMQDAACVRKFDAKPTVDGVISESEWGKPTRTVKDDGTLCSVISMRVGNTGKFADAPKNPDQTYDIWLRWDNDFFYMAVKTADKTHFNKYADKADSGNVWNGDALQISFDTLGAGNAFASDADKIMFALATDGTLYKHSWSCVFSNVEGKDTLLKIKNDGSYTSYEIAIPWNDLMSGDLLKKVKADSVFGLTTVVLSATDGDYDGWLSWGDGVCAPQEDSSRVGFNKIILSDLSASDTSADPAFSRYTVTFKNDDGSVISTQKVFANEAGIAPAAPKKDGYKFSKWDVSFSKITADTTVTAQFIKIYKVTFADYDGTELKAVNVGDGEKATPPKDPAREGYTFTGWDKTFDAINSDTTITAQYTKVEEANNEQTGEVITTDEATATNEAPVNNEQPVEEDTPDNTWLYIVIGVVVVAVGIGIFFGVKKKKA
ncbi:MAG: InlB B-repeat-containing protein [Oscillospiraceae bacterium]|nr:InlB B-repeat-containing protein [Oscillospiraceae bacterium]